MDNNDLDFPEGSVVLIETPISKMELVGEDDSITTHGHTSYLVCVNPGSYMEELVLAIYVRENGKEDVRQITEMDINQLADMIDVGVYTIEEAKYILRTLKGLMPKRRRKDD